MQLTAEQAIEDELVICWLYTEDIKKDWRKALHAIIEYHVQIAIDPQVSDHPTKIIRDFLAPHLGQHIRKMSFEEINVELGWTLMM